MRLVPSRKFAFSAIMLSILLPMTSVSAGAIATPFINTAAPLGEDMFIQATTTAGGDDYTVSLPLSELKEPLPLQQTFMTGGGAVAQVNGGLPGGSVSGRLAVFPYGTTHVEVAGVQVDGVELTRTAVQAGDVMIMRGIPIVPLTVNHAAFAGFSGSGDGSAQIRFAVQGDFGGFTSSGDENPVLSLLRGAPRNPDGSVPNNRGCYLIVTSETLQPALTPLIDWKTREGYEVKVVTLTETGPSKEEIKAYLKQAYETWENPPLYVLLAGDADGEDGVAIEADNVSGTVTDHKFSRLDGDDILPDVFVGRLPANTLHELTLHVAKTVNYLSVPLMDESNWQNKALTVAVSLNSTTGVPLCSWVGEQLKEFGYASVDTVHDVEYGQIGRHGPEMIDESINNGVSLLLYRGWAYGDLGWIVDSGGEPYVNDNINELANGWKLPVVFSIVCHTGNYGRE